MKKQKKKLSEEIVENSASGIWKCEGTKTKRGDGANHNYNLMLNNIAIFIRHTENKHHNTTFYSFASFFSSFDCCSTQTTI